MVIGFDASRAFVDQRTGTENYSYQLLKSLAKIDKKNRYRVYLRPSQSVIPAQAGIQKEMDPWVMPSDRVFSPRPEDDDTLWPQNFEFKVINWPRFWTQGGLAWECLVNPPDVLFVPAHTMPVIRRPSLKTVVTIHDLGAEYLPQYHQFPQKYYLNWSTEYVVKHTTKIIAVSESTKKDLIIKLLCDEEKIRVVYEGIRGL